MPNVETLAMLDPDVVVQWGDRGDDIVAPLRNAGRTKALLRYGTEAFACGNLTMMADKVRFYVVSAMGLEPMTL